MADLSGRAVRIKYDADGSSSNPAVVIAKAKSDEITINNEPIDTTSKDEAGIRTLLNDLGSKSMEISCSGIMTNGAQHKSLAELVTESGEGTALYTFEVEVVGVGTWRGQWFITSFKIGGEDGANHATFEMSMASAGTIAFTAAV